LNQLAAELGIKQVILPQDRAFQISATNNLQATDWYGVTRKEVLHHGGWGLFYHYTTLFDALKAAYPDHDWNESNFYARRATPPGYWTNKEHLGTALDRAENQLGIQQVFSPPPPNNKHNTH